MFFTKTVKGESIVKIGGKESGREEFEVQCNTDKIHSFCFIPCSL